MKKRSMSVVRLLLLLAVLSACEPEQSPPPVLETFDEAVSQESTADAHQLSVDLWALTQELLKQSVSEASFLDASIQTFLQQPTAENLAVARQQWHSSVEAFQRVQPLLFLPSQSDDTRDAMLLSMAQWPFYPGFIDSYGGYTDSGIVNAIDTPLSLPLVMQYHQQYESSELLLGFYPMAYLLWGENTSRLLSDFEAVTELPDGLDSALLKVSQLPQNRRRQLLRLQSEWLVLSLNARYDSHVAGDWLRAYEALLPRERIRLMTNSLLASLNTLFNLQQEAYDLPPLLQQHQYASWLQTLSNIERYYFDHGLAAYWLIAEERILAEQLFTWLLEDDWQASHHGNVSNRLRSLITLITPDANALVVDDVK